MIPPKIPWISNLKSFYCESDSKLAPDARNVLVISVTISSLTKMK
jgi:hypothetical protein